MAGEFNFPDIMWMDGHGSESRIETNTFFLND